MASQPPNPDTIKLLLELAREKLALQENAWDAQRTKAGFVLAADAIALAQLHELVISGRGPLVPLLVLAVIGAGGFAIVAIWPRRVSAGGDITKYLREFGWQNPNEALPHLATHYAHAIDNNEVAIKEAGRAMRFALGFLAAALGLFIVLTTNVA